MKAIRNVLSGKGLPRRGEKGFTLVELLIVLAILAVLAAVVIPNVTGMFGRGAAQAWDTDIETLQMSSATFYFDTHDMDGSASATILPGHRYPTVDGLAGTGETEEDVVMTGAIAGDIFTCATSTDGNASAGTYKIVYMGLLANTPGVIDWDVDGRVETGEKGPYLNEVPQSATSLNYDATVTGSYLWVIGVNGVVYGLYDTLGTNLVYSVGFADVYP